MRKGTIVRLAAGLLAILLPVWLNVQCVLAKESITLQQEFVSRDEMAKMAAARSELFLSDAAGNVQWHFREVTRTMDFLTEAIMTKNKLGEVYVEFVQEGTLPGDGEVTIFLNKDINPFAEGQEVLLYYINPVTQRNEFVETGVVQDGSVTFAMEHCSLYLITTTDYGASYVPDVGGIGKRVAIVGGVVAAAGISILHRRKRMKRLQEERLLRE